MLFAFVILGVAVLCGAVFGTIAIKKSSNKNNTSAPQHYLIGAKEKTELKKGEECALRLKDIVKIYGSNENEVHALKGVNLNFRKNEFVSVLGPSGCGKTTLLNIIGGLDRYTKGDLIINGVSTKNYKDGDWDTYRNNSIGFVFQNYNLIPHQTVLKNVELALTLSGVSKKEREEKARAVLNKVGLKDQEKKLPNQLSGGQMQRVAIARALVNDPEIILADEPTGALDTETSVQVLDLLKEVANDRLVIMVTHNPDLAEKYSTRIINLLDGEMIGDTNPLNVSIDYKPKTNKGKSAMRYSTAMGLSLSNLKTKKGRTALTSIAGSIGIIGIALVLALSTGFSAFIDKLQADTLSVYPITISESSIDLEDFEKLTSSIVTDEMKAQKLAEKVYTKALFGDLSNMLESNDINQVYNKDGNSISYLDYVSSFVNSENEKVGEDSWRYCLEKDYGFDVNYYLFSEVGLNIGGTQTQKVMAIDTLVQYFEEYYSGMISNSGLNISSSFVREYIPTISEIPSNQKLVQSQYDLLHGDWATNKNQLLLVVDEYNQVPDVTLAFLGYNTINGMKGAEVTFGDKKEFTFRSACEKKFYYLENDSRYTSVDGNYIQSMFDLNAMPEGAEELSVVGVVRLKDGLSSGVLKTGIAYTSAFKTHILSNENLNSNVVNAAKESGGKLAVVNPLIVADPLVPSAPVIMSLRELAGDPTVSKISIYSADYACKENLKEYLNEWNTKIIDPSDTEAEVHFSDTTDMLFSALNMIVDAVKIVLIAFTAVSLVVSSIMIGIITYVSVVERTKEIGVLRSLGARKKDISRIFNAETFFIGLFAGLLGVGITYLLSIPINLIVGGLISGGGSIASLKIFDAGVLVVVSFLLTLIAGIFPSRIAAKKDPVIALRTE